MSKSLQVTPSEQIEQVFAGPDHEVGLGEAALVLARLEYPDLNVQAHLDQFVRRFWQQGALLGSGLANLSDSELHHPGRGTDAHLVPDLSSEKRAPHR